MNEKIYYEYWDKSWKRLRQRGVKILNKHSTVG